MAVNKSLQLIALTRELDETKARLAAIESVLSAPIDNYTVQSCCICYGGNSFPGPMKEALECFVEIMQSRVDDPDFRCRGCGRPESVCSANPCKDVISDRAE
jgi:hypothetical protein